MARTYGLCHAGVLDAQPPFFLSSPGLHSYHIFAAALDRSPVSLPWQQELHAGCPSSGIALGTRHVHRGV